MQSTKVSIKRQESHNYNGGFLVLLLAWKISYEINKIVQKKMHTTITVYNLPLNKKTIPMIFYTYSQTV